MTSRPDSTLRTPPKLRQAQPGEADRRATWFELFYDLVFVVAIAQLSTRLAGDVSTRGILEFVVIAIPVWWSWVGATFYASRFDTDDLGHRLLTTLQMLPVATMALGIRTAFTTGLSVFALSYAALRLMLVVEYLRAGRHIPDARPLTRRYATGFTIAASIWIVSAMPGVPTAARVSLWAAALAIDFATPLTAQGLQARIPPDFSHLPERFGLFTIIVLGEWVVLLVTKVAGAGTGLAAVAGTVCGLAIVVALWWLYFDNFQTDRVAHLHTAPEGHAHFASVMKRFQLWLYSHLPLTIAIVASGVGVQRLVQSAAHGSHRGSPGAVWLVCASLALALVLVFVINVAGPAHDVSDRSRRRQLRVRIAAVVALACVGAAYQWTSLGSSRYAPIVVLVACAATMVATVASNMRDGAGAAACRLRTQPVDTA